MVRVLHFADIHIGIENYGRLNAESGVSSRVLDFLARMDEIVGYAREHDAELCIFAGDAFKTRQPNPTLQREFAVRIRELADLCPVVLLVGNHDLPTNLLRASTVEIFETLAVPNVVVGRDFQVFNIETRGGPVTIATAPYPVRAMLIDSDTAGGYSIAEADDQMRAALSRKLEGMARAAADSPYPRLLTGHFTIDGAAVGTERGLMLGRDVSAPLSEIADPVWDYVAMGHVHRHQNLTQGRAGSPPVVYSGSPECIDFGEEGDQKGFCWIELERGSTRWQFIPVDYRHFVTLSVDVRGLLDPLGEVMAAINRENVSGAVVRVQIQADEDAQQALDERKMTQALYARGADFVAAVDKQIERIARRRLAESPEGLTPLELLEKYLQSRSIPRDRIDLLIAKARDLFEEQEE